MTVAATIRKAGPTPGNGLATVFPFAFKVFAATDIQVIRTVIATGVQTVLVLNDPLGYTVALNVDQNANPGGSITYNPLGVPLPATQQLTIVSVVPQAQGTHIINGGAFFANNIEDAVDKAVINTQDLAAKVASSIQFPAADSAALNAILPAAASRVNSYVAFDGAGNVIASPGPTSQPVSVAMLPVVQAATLALGRAALDVSQAINSLVEDPTPDKTADFVASFDASAAGDKKIKLQNLPLPRSHLSGLGLANNAGDAVNDIDIAVGEARDSGNVANIVLAAALTKQLDVAWAVGTNAGGRASGAAIANATYFVFVIKRPDTGVVDVAYDTSATGANIAANTNANYTQIRRIGSIIRSAGAIFAFKQDGDKFVHAAPFSDVAVVNPGIAAVTRGITVPIGIRVEAILTAAIATADNTGAVALRLSDLSTTDVAVSGTISQVSGTFSGAGNTVVVAAECRVFTDTAGQIRTRVNLSSANVTILIGTHGWWDRRGQDA